MKIPLKEIRLDSGTIVCGLLTKGVSCKAESGLLLTYDSELEVVVCERQGFDTELLPVHFVVKMTPQVWPVGAKAIDESLVDGSTRELDADVMQEAKERAGNEPAKEPIVVDETAMESDPASAVVAQPPASVLEGFSATEDLSKREVLMSQGLPIAERAWTGDYRDSSGQIIDSSAVDYSQESPEPAHPKEEAIASVASSDGVPGVEVVLCADIPEDRGAFIGHDADGALFARSVPLREKKQKPKRKKGRK